MELAMISALNHQTILQWQPATNGRTKSTTLSAPLTIWSAGLKMYCDLKFGRHTDIHLTLQALLGYYSDVDPSSFAIRGSVLVCSDLCS